MIYLSYSMRVATELPSQFEYFRGVRVALTALLGGVTEPVEATAIKIFTGKPPDVAHSVSSPPFTASLVSENCLLMSSCLIDLSQIKSLLHSLYYAKA